MRLLLAQLVLLISLLTLTPSWCGALEVTLQRIDAMGIGESIGSVTVQDTDQGLVIYPDLAGLSPGEHGFHLHSTGSCEVGETDEGKAVAGLAAGGHWDPDETGQHLGPFGNGHRGDLSRLVVDGDGKTNTSVVAPRLSTADLKGKALIVHAGGDTYRDEPPSVEVVHGLPVVWCRTSADSAVHQAGMKATDPDGLSGWLLTDGTEFPVELVEQGQIRSGN